MTRKESTPTIRDEHGSDVAMTSEQDKARNPMRNLRIGDSDHQINRWYPLKGGAHAESNAQACFEEAPTQVQTTGERAVYALTRKESRLLDSPTLGVGEEDRLVGLPVFTTREKALLYLQLAQWDSDHVPAALSPADLKLWLDESRGSGINVAIVDPDRSGHLQGEPQPVLYLMEMADVSADALFSEIRELAQGTMPGT